MRPTTALGKDATCGKDLERWSKPSSRDFSYRPDASYRPDPIVHVSIKASDRQEHPCLVRLKRVALTCSRIIFQSGWSRGKWQLSRNFLSNAIAVLKLHLALSQNIFNPLPMCPSDSFPRQYYESVFFLNTPQPWRSSLQLYLTELTGNFSASMIGRSLQRWALPGTVLSHGACYYSDILRCCNCTAPASGIGNYSY